MACCALAAFLIGQMIIFWDRIRSCFGTAAPAYGATAYGAADWRPGQVLPTRKAAPRRRWGFVLATAGAFGMAGAAYAAASPATVELGNTGIFVSLCGGADSYWEKLLAL